MKPESVAKGKEGGQTKKPLSLSEKLALLGKKVSGLKVALSKARKDIEQHRQHIVILQEQVNATRETLKQTRQTQDVHTEQITSLVKRLASVERQADRTEQRITPPPASMPRARVDADKLSGVAL